jgi:hypothetical protein
VSGVKVVVVLVKCTQSLLFCEDIDTQHHRFADIEECTTRLPGLIAEAARTAGLERVVMDRCRFQLDGGTRRPPAALSAPSG